METFSFLCVYGDLELKTWKEEKRRTEGRREDDDDDDGRVNLSLSFSLSPLPSSSLSLYLARRLCFLFSGHHLCCYYRLSRRLY